MRACIHTRYGAPDVLSLVEIDSPLPKEDEVLVKVKATSVNRTDCGFRQAEYFLVRMFSGWFRPKRQILGSELAGVVEAIGAKVIEFKVGDEIFGLNTYKFGTHADYVCIQEKKAITRKPSNLSFIQSAGICDGAFLAWANLTKINLQAKPKILVNGASGSIGTAAVQLATNAGSTVHAVCNSKNKKLVANLGATLIYDYTCEDFTQSNEKYDVVLDMVGKSSFFKCKKILKPGGIYISSELGYMWQNIFLALITPLIPGKKVYFPVPVDRKKDMEYFRDLCESGKYKPVIDRVYPFAEIVEATRYVETGEKVGNVIINLEHP